MNKEKIAKIDNGFILNAQYKMSAREQKILYYLISHLDPKNEQDFNIITVPVREIEETIKEGSKKWGDFHVEMDLLCKSLIKKHIEFPSNFLVHGKPLKGYVTWFYSIRPVQDETGQVCIRFAFSPDMKPFLLQLHHYVNIGVIEIVPMKNAHAIRMYSIFKSEKDRLKGIKNIITLSYGIDELKALLGIENNYQNGHIRDLKKYVLDKIRDEINEKCPTMFVKYDYLKTRRKVTGITFTVYERQQTAGSIEAPKPKKEKKEKIDIKDYKPTEKELATLTRAKIQGYNILTEYGIFDGIAYKQILPKIKGSEFEGFEDFFIEKAIQHFEKTAIQNTTKELKASTFVTWWTKNKVFDSGDVWADILEKLVKHKKQMQEKQPIAFENRMIAKTMTNKQFVDFIGGDKN